MKTSQTFVDSSDEGRDHQHRQHGPRDVAGAVGAPDRLSPDHQLSRALRGPQPASVRTLGRHFGSLVTDTLAQIHRLRRVLHIHNDGGQVQMILRKQPFNQK